MRAATEAVDRTPSGPYLAGGLGILARALACRWDASEDCADLDKAISLTEHALELTSADADRIRLQGTLAAHLFTRWRHFAVRSDLERACALGEEAGLLPPNLGGPPS